MWDPGLSSENGGWFQGQIGQSRLPSYVKNEKWEMRVSCNHIDEAYGGPDADMLKCILRFEK